ncbi:glycosyltransferase family 2 protein [Serratia sp. DD3]|uniref:glycosyltransferase family 2 protein n=1 Tax=Serratia sp. DD3 TaxID=1410619 RepID=UPI0004D3BF17|nr:glycosyltransferase family 2 protein [Serratia sp. DD3]KEY56511.1 putative glycosyltransferase EpsJ [Serratia sp. DD3]KEY56731.1 putative glycosyltransferase EpsJ [Serratia sp. DD3]KEY58336.1 putative glycosyltransferase EpsJ [Serratia sp. DD3]KEY59442.1 putative glycosyltransferase EpsJ [Serratia sp. DD3]
MNLTSPLLSIIVPFYNNEDFIIDSLGSLFDQIRDDIEVVIIDDGSTDSSFVLVNEFLLKKQHPLVKFISQTNGGIANARNVGLQNAGGRYVTFLDGDDMLCTDYLAVLYPLLLEDHEDLIDFNYQKFTVSPSVLPTNQQVKHIVYDFQHQGLDCLKPLFANSMWHLWSRVYRRTLLAGDTFENGRRYEDVIFTPFQYFKTRKIAHIDHALYLYRDNNQGITRNIKAKDIEDMLFAMKKMLQFVAQHQGDEPLRQLAALMLANCFSEVKSMSKIVYGYYHYEPETLNTLRQAAMICQDSDVPGKKVRQMRYARVDTFLSKMRWWLRTIIPRRF